MRKITFAIKCLLIAGLTLFATSAVEATSQRYNVLVILVDAANPDHFSSYGYKRRTTPNFDMIAEDGFLFENAISQAWYTLPSHASIFTGKYPHNHHVLDKQSSLPETETTLAEVLKNAGYNTAAFVGGVFLEPAYGMAQGFNTYRSTTAEQPEIFAGQLGRSHTIIPMAIKWLEENKERPFFLFVHNYDLFSPTRVPYEFKQDKDYEGIADELLSSRRLNLTETHRHTYRVGIYNSAYMKEVQLTQRDREHIISDYDDGLSYSDAWHKKLFDKLEDLGLKENTIIIITSDHGTDLLGHGKFKLYMRGSPYDEVLKVPLIIRHPGLRQKGAKKITDQVQLIDLMPTILDMLSVRGAPDMDGKSFLPQMNSDPKAVLNPFAYGGWDWLRMIRTTQWKLIYQNGLYELYDLKKDPGELTNLADGRHPQILPMLERLFDWSRKESPTRKTQLIEIDEKLRKALREAGYW